MQNREESTALTATIGTLPAAMPSSRSLDPDYRKNAMELAEIYLRSGLVPESLSKENKQLLPDDVIVARVFRVACAADNWGYALEQVIDCAAVIRGKLAWEGKMFIAVVNDSGLVRAPLRFEYSGEGQSRSVDCIGHFKSEAEPRRLPAPVTVKEAATTNENWKKQPDMMLAYFAARRWARKNCPNAMFGMRTIDEANDEPIEVEIVEAPKPKPSGEDETEEAPAKTPEELHAIACAATGEKAKATNWTPAAAAEVLGITEEPVESWADFTIDELREIVGRLMKKKLISEGQRRELEAEAKKASLKTREDKQEFLQSFGAGYPWSAIPESKLAHVIASLRAI